jgi:hypothetical protein
MSSLSTRIRRTTRFMMPLGFGAHFTFLPWSLSLVPRAAGSFCLSAQVCPFSHVRQAFVHCFPLSALEYALSSPFLPSNYTGTILRRPLASSLAIIANPTCCPLCQQRTTGPQKPPGTLARMQRPTTRSATANATSAITSAQGLRTPLRPLRRTSPPVLDPNIFPCRWVSSIHFWTLFRALP